MICLDNNINADAIAMMSDKAEQAIRFPNLGMQLKFSGLKDFIKEKLNNLCQSKFQVYIEHTFITLIS